MYELMQHLIAFKYGCKINHWTTGKYADHLLFDRLAEGIDDTVDDIAEKYFMASGKKLIFKSDLLNPKMIDHDLVKSIKAIIKHLEKLQQDPKLDCGMGALLSATEEAFLTKLALAQLS